MFGPSLHRVAAAVTLRWIRPSRAPKEIDCVRGGLYLGSLSSSHSDEWSTPPLYQETHISLHWLAGNEIQETVSVRGGVQLDLTPEIEVHYIPYIPYAVWEVSYKNRKRSNKQHLKYFNFRSKFNLDNPVLFDEKGGCKFDLFPYAVKDILSSCGFCARLFSDLEGRHCAKKR